MTLNGVRVPCYCKQCGGRSRDYRTAEKHASAEKADQPLYPSTLEASPKAKDDHIDNQQLPIPPVVEQKEQVPSAPYPDVLIEDMISHVEAMPNCNMPVFETVPRHTHVCMFVYVGENSALFKYSALFVPLVHKRLPKFPQPSRVPVLLRSTQPTQLPLSAR